MNVTKFICVKSLSTYAFNTFRIFSSCDSSIRSTIYALSSGYGKCGVAVLRISGPNASKVIFNMTGMLKAPNPRLAKLCKIRDPVSKETLDRGLVLWFPGPNSFTGEDVCELHVHGGPAVISSVLTALSKLSGFQPAEPGEFTRRAFYSQKLDLTEVEGLADLLSAETEAQRKQAYLQMEGSLSILYSKWRQSLLQCVAHLEAFIDFSEDENIEENIMLEVNSKLLQLEKEIHSHVLQSKCGERLREGVRTVIIGKPNVGKSSLLNILCKRPAAIVTPVAGTTRDALEIHMNFGGYPVLLVDTAGLRSTTNDEIEIEGMNRARSYANAADLILFVMDAVHYESQITTRQTGSFEDYVRNYIESSGVEDLKCSICSLISDSQSSTSCIFVLNKSDLLENQNNLLDYICSDEKIILLSCKTGKGIDSLHEKITQNLIELCGSPCKENPNFTQARHRYHLSHCVQCLSDYFQLFENNGDLVLAAQKLRRALRHIGYITGHVNTEQILDVIFKDFCIGK